MMGAQNCLMWTAWSACKRKQVHEPESGRDMGLDISEAYICMLVLVVYLPTGPFSPSLAPTFSLMQNPSAVCLGPLSCR
ncbi:hypothetical protein M440DRAFT_1396127 [Trichoderma longibrachiatum ATCC 18648]|uniref:Uncharacterized protein n=1 Tax=Trichoderma longibrachiatum ATCC 18648 TaxID=983965 RepID=A0A2T4CHC2_TRILO|nr:hypothetical protein M440DRAFT_1396127 [Trichoderma longibrachiatum ATCC 18648]